jgi:hypothetical protein
MFTEEHWHTLERSRRFESIFELAMLISNAQSQGKAHLGEEKWDHVEQNFKSVYGRAKYLFCGTRAMRDQEYIDFLKEYKINFYDTHQDHFQYDELVEVAHGWVAGHLDISESLQLIPMTSTRNALLEFLQKNNDRRVRIHQQEYWNMTQLKHYSVNPVYFTEPIDISDGDCVIVTLPLHGIFELPDWTYELFDACDKKGVPVFIDCCWAWLQHNFNLRLNHECIDTVTCTLGKLFPIEGYRNGFKFVKRKNVAKYDMLYSSNRLGNRMLIDIMRRFPADHLVSKYKGKQKFWGEKLGLPVTHSVLNCHGADDLLWYSTHRVLANDGLNQKLFSIVPLLENHQMLVDYINEKDLVF